MAPEAPKKPKKKYLGLSPLAWGGIAAGGVVVYIYLARRRAAATAATQTATSGGTTIPGVGASTSGTSAAALPSTLPEWIQAFLSGSTNATYTPSEALNDVNGWLLGNCVSQAGYTAIGAAVESLGLPPGYGTVPTLSVCAAATTSGTGTGSTSGGGTTTTTTTTSNSPPPSSPSTPSAPNLSPSLAAAMANNGESLIGEVWDAATNTWIFATNKGGIYTETAGGTPGGTFYGSYLGLPAADTQGGPRTFANLIVNSDGSYTLVSTTGQDYTFNPTTPQT